MPGKTPDPSRINYQRRVTYSDCTMGDHVYYARYLNMLEEARGELFRQMGRTFLEWQQEDSIFPVIECHVRYRAQAKYDDVLTIAVWITLAEGARLNFAYRVTDANGLLILEAETFHACTTVAGKPKRVPQPLKR